jgi:large conductance mechanosensitive channel
MPTAPIGVEGAKKATQAARGLAKEFRDFIVKQNVVALAAGVVIGGAVGKVVSGIVDNVIMPIIGAILPGQNEWKQAKLPIGSSNFILYGDLIGRLVDFAIVAFVVFLVLKAFVKPAPPAAPAPATKSCPMCLETIPAAARRCRACGSEV